MSEMLISAQQLIKDISNPNLLIIDVRHSLQDINQGNKLFNESHILGAHFLHQDDDLSSELNGTNGRHPLPNPSLLLKKLEKIGLKSDTKVVVYDAGNSFFAVRAWWLLRWLGHANVVVLDGGLNAWNRANGPCVSGAPAQFNLIESDADVSFNVAMPVKNVDQVLEIIKDDKYVLLDARDYVRYIGETEPLDPVAGHIPGAINRPIINNLNNDLTFKEPAVLLKEFQDLIPNHDSSVVVNYCGSGVTACHNIFAMELAGLTGSSLYSGSWSEWCSDASRPMQLAN